MGAYLRNYGIDKKINFSFSNVFDLLCYDLFFPDAQEESGNGHYKSAVTCEKSK